MAHWTLMVSSDRLYLLLLPLLLQHQRLINHYDSCCGWLQHQRACACEPLSSRLLLLLLLLQQRRSIDPVAANPAAAALRFRHHT
jgi:hypothetical protein